MTVGEETAVDYNIRVTELGHVAGAGALSLDSGEGVAAVTPTAGWSLR